MKKTICLSALAALAFGAGSLRAQVVVNPALPAAPAIQAPVPATPVSPTLRGEDRAIRREDRRIDRNDPTGTLAPTVNPRGTVTAAPGAVNANVGVAAPVAAAPGFGANVGVAAPVVGANVNAGVAAENWRYRQQNGQWMYYTPQNNWMLWNGSAWGAYTPNAPIAAPVAPANVGVRAYSYPANQGYNNNGYYNNGYNNGYNNNRYYNNGYNNGYYPNRFYRRAVRRGYY